MEGKKLTSPNAEEESDIKEGFTSDDDLQGVIELSDAADSSIDHTYRNQRSHSTYTFFFRFQKNRRSVSKI